MTSDPRAITHLEQTVFSGRLGALYAFGIGLSPFASYTESFEPQTGAARDGTPFAPVTGRQYDAGLKFQPRGTDALFNLSAYDLRRHNVPIGDPANSGLAGMTFTVNAANLFDTRHVASCFFNNACYFGASRTVMGTLRVDW